MSSGPPPPFGYHAPHVAAPQAGAVREEWTQSLPRPHRMQVRDHTYACTYPTFELRTAGGLWFVRHHPNENPAGILESAWMSAPAARELWLRILSGQAQWLRGARALYEEGVGSPLGDLLWGGLIGVGAAWEQAVVSKLEKARRCTRSLGLSRAATEVSPIQAAMAHHVEDTSSPSAPTPSALPSTRISPDGKTSKAKKHGRTDAQAVPDSTRQEGASRIAAETVVQR